ncbi:hypothetical protein BKP54_28910 [Ensifer sp. 1H6]|nr:hypothetical protein BKP54_28910 [Ensifer sp. 1H6]
MQSDQRGCHRVHDAFRHLVSVAIKDSRIRHQVTDVAHQHQRAAWQGQRAPTWRRVDAIGVEAAHEAAAALGDFLLEIALHQAEPVAVYDDLVFGIDRRNRIFAVHDGGDRGFENDVGNMSRVILADRSRRIENDDGMQIVVPENDLRRRFVRTRKAGKLLGVAKRRLRSARKRNRKAAGSNLQRRNIRPAAAFQRRACIEEVARPGNDLGAALGIVAASLFRTAFVGNGIGAVEGVIERTPACVGGVEGIACIHDGNDELRTGDRSDFRIDIISRNRKLGALRQEITYLLQKALVGFEVARRAIFAIPGIDPGLQIVALGKQGAVLRREVMDDLRQRGKKPLGVDAGARHRLVDQKAMQTCIDLQSVFLNAVHLFTP